MRTILLIFMVVFFLAAWIALYLGANTFLNDWPQWARVSSALGFSAIWGALMWYFRPRDS